MVVFAEIDDLAARIAHDFDPDKIILFGSHADGTQRLNSDVDLLIVLPVEGKCWRKAAEIRGRVNCRFPLDLLVRTPDEVRWRVAAGDPFLREVTERGKVLHAKDYSGMG